MIIIVYSDSQLSYDRAPETGGGSVCSLLHFFIYARCGPSLELPTYGQMRLHNISFNTERTEST